MSSDRDGVRVAQGCVDLCSLAGAVRELQVPTGIRSTGAAAQRDSPGGEGQVLRIKVDRFQAVARGFTHFFDSDQLIQVRQRSGRIGVEFLFNFHVACGCHDRGTPVFWDATRAGQL